MSKRTLPLSRPRMGLAALALAVVFTPSLRPARAEDAPSPAEFSAHIQSLWPAAKTVGVSRETFDSALKGVKFDDRIVKAIARQPETTTPIWTYLSKAATASRVDAAKRAWKQNASWLDKASRIYGVDPAIILALWALETGFGDYYGSNDVVESLATLSFLHYRGRVFDGELVSALKILESGEADRARLRGSWAGAMGLPQFLPSTYLDFAVDFDGDGRRDIWSSRPDAIGSIANYLNRHGWKSGEPWGLAVEFPDAFQAADADFMDYAAFTTFAERGVKPATGFAWPAAGKARLFLPAGHAGPAFLVTKNFDAIKSYNNSSSYALAAAFISDGAAGRSAASVKWPVDLHLLSPAEVQRLKTCLRDKGLDPGEINGRFGEIMRVALQKFQLKIGVEPDGFPTRELLIRNCPIE